jgi:hypothetical protein
MLCRVLTCDVIRVRKNTKERALVLLGLVASRVYFPANHYSCVHCCREFSKKKKINQRISVL